MTKAGYLELDRGLSPRGRGNRVHFTADFLALGSIPAWAGEPQRGNCTP